MKKFLLCMALVALTACNLQRPINLPGLPTSIPQATETPIFTPTPEPSPTLPPTPTPIPAVRIETGDDSLLNGDYDRAREDFRIALEGAADDDTRAAALWGSARVDYEDENYAGALDLLRLLVGLYPNAHQTPWAYFLLGETYDALQRSGEAADAYRTYLTLRPGKIDSYAQEKLGDSLYAAGDNASALTAYRASLTMPRLGDNLEINKKIAQMYIAIGSSQQALEIYEQINQTTSNDYVKAQMDLLIGQTYLARGESDLAYERFQHAVQNYPLSYDSYSALVALVEAGIPVNDLDRGLVDYHAGQYGLALGAFDRYLQNQNPDDDGTVHHYRALTLREMGMIPESIASWDILINQYPNNRYWSTAWDEKAYTQWAYLEDYGSAAQTWLDFVKAAPQSPSAPEYLFSAARTLERGSRLEEAAGVWERIANEYSSSANAVDALHFAGISRYRLGDYDGAIIDFQRTLLLASEVEDQARANFWIGKSQMAKNDLPATATAFQAAQNLDPTGYYSERARDILTGRNPFEVPIGHSFGVNLPAEREDADAWLRATFNLPPETNLTDLGTLAQDERFIRGTEFWELGLYNEAREEFIALRDAVSGNAADSYRLGNYLLDVGLYRQAIYALRQVLTLAGLDNHAESLDVPKYFSHIRYGLYYSDIIIQAAKNLDFDPLFLFSVVRQESLFEGFVRSSAGARGLMQIMPDTADSIVQSLSYPPNYKPDDLYRPLVNVNLGSSYLNTNRNNMGGDLYAALAAYNAGPGNAAIWQQLGNGDPDLFVEVVRFAETRDYIRSIYEIYTIYKGLYSPIQ
jgi:soluble lytic murein transglycosylase